MDSLIKPEDLFEKVKELGQPAVAVTDHGTLFSAWDCWKASKKTGVKLLMGCEFNFVDDLNENQVPRHVILIAKNHQGYKNLLNMNKIAYDNLLAGTKKVIPRIDWKTLEDNSEGVLCTTACSGGILGQLINTRRSKEAFAQAERLKSIFGESLFFEIQPHAMVRKATNYNDYEDQRLVNNVLVDFAGKLGVRIVPTTDAHYLTPEEWETHDTLLAMGQGLPARMKSRLKYSTNDFYVKSREEVLKFLRRYYRDKAEEFCDNTLIAAEMCETPKWIDPRSWTGKDWELPNFPVQDQEDYQEFKNWLAAHPQFTGKPEDVNYLRFWSFRSLEKIGKANDQVYVDRVEKELDTFEYRDLSSYMLIVADYINWAKNNGCLVGPGRGSAGGSLVGYLTGIHEADSIKYGLIFERFYSKIKKGISDIDTDFGQSSKPKVQQYLIKKYGKDMVAHVSNLSTMTPKVYVKDICRTFEYGGNRSAAAEVGQRIADSIPASMKTIDQALDEAPLFAEYAAQEKYNHLKKFKDISGSIRNLSTHAGGIIIASRPIHELVPTRRDKDYNYAIEYDKDRAEDNSLVKMDILGVSTLDVIDNTIKIIKSRGKEPPPPWTYDDPKTYELITSGNTKGVFQLGTSQNTMTICQKMRPKNIEDLAMINSMARPGFPRAVIDDFIKDKETGNIANLIHPILEEALGPTFGYALFDEVLLKLAETVAGWDLAEADRLRKFVKEKGKNPKKDKKLRADFVEGAINNKGLTEEEATQIWDEVLSNLGAYVFNKSHAVCYSMISYQTAYLKAHYPLEFMVANLIHEDGTNAQTRDKNIQEYKKELRDNGIKILPPDLNKSQEVYSILDDGKILTGFSSLKSIGKDAIPEILEKRPFDDFDDFLTKIDNSKVRINSVYSLASAGCLDGFGLTRRQICLYAADYRKKLETWQERRPDEEFVYPWPDDVSEWSVAEMFAQETYYLGEGLCCGIKEAYPGFFNNWALDFSKVPDIFPESESYGNQKFFIPANVGVVQAVIKDLFTFTVKKETSKIFGQTMAKIDLEDPWGNVIPMTLFPSSLERFLERLRTLSRGKIDLEVGIAVHCAASINWYEGEPSLIFEDLRQVAPIPPRPKDLKPRKVTMKITKKKTQKKKKNALNRQKLLLDIEAELIEEGHSDIEYE